MTIAFAILSALCLVSGIAVFRLRNLVHAALALVVTFSSLAGFYLMLGAEFAGFAQILVYVGAVAILIVFALLLTRSSEQPAQRQWATRWWIGAALAGGVWVTMLWLILSSASVHRSSSKSVAAPVRDLGDSLMTRYLIPLEVMGLLLTAALIGAVVIAMSGKRSVGREGSGQPPA